MPYIRIEFFEKTSLKTKKWSLKMDKKIYKPGLIMAVLNINHTQGQRSQYLNELQKVGKKYTNRGL